MISYLYVDTIWKRATFLLPPVNVAATATSSTSIRVTWSKATVTNGNNNISIRYYVTFYPTSVGLTGSKGVLVTTGASTQLENLKESTTYTIFIQSLTDNVLSEPSNSVMETTPRARRCIIKLPDEVGREEMENK